MKIAVIDNYDSFVFNLIRYLEESGAEVQVMRNDQIDGQILDEANAILLSPGPGIPTEAGRLMQVIEKYYSKKSILGVCLGHQALAEFFGNELELCEAPLHGEASKMDILENEALFKNLEKSTEVGRYHSWKTTRNLKAPLQITALSEQDEVMAFQHESLPIFGVQFHPESILTPDGRAMIQNWIEIVTAKRN